MILTHHNRFDAQYDEVDTQALMPLNQEFISIENFITKFLAYFNRPDNAETRAEVRKDFDRYASLNTVLADFGGELGIVVLINNDFRLKFDEFADNGRTGPGETFIPIEEYITRFLAYFDMTDNVENRAAVRADLDWWNEIDSILIDLGAGLIVLLPSDD